MNFSWKIKRNFYLILLPLIVCSIQISGITSNTVQREYWPTNEWKTSNPVDQEMNPSIMNKMVNFIETNESTGLDKIDSILIVKNGYIVYEEYFDYLSELKHCIYSATKSVTSALIGIAIDQGYLNLTDKVLTIFSDRNITNVDQRKEAITIEHLLQMRSGLEWTREEPNDTTAKMWVTDDWVQFILNLPMEIDPGNTFEYSNGASHLLTGILHEVTGKTPLEFAQEYLFIPIGITTDKWTTDPKGINMGFSELYLTSRDMARFGFLYLNNGTWNNSQRISKNWIESSIYSYLDEPIYEPMNYRYGYHWWILAPNETKLFSLGGISHTIPCFMNVASGMNGQEILCIPSMDLVVVFTAHDTTQNQVWPIYNHLIFEYIIPAVTEYIPPSTSGFPVFYAFIALFSILLWNRKK